MKPVVKWLLLGCGLLLLGGLVIAFLAAIWFVDNKDRLIDQTRATGDEGAQFGKLVKEPECLSEALSRYKASRTPFGAVRHGVWLHGCLSASAADPSFCEGVPSDNEMMATVSWRIARCRSEGFEGDSNCPNLLGQVQQYCHGSERQAKLQSRP